MLLDECNIRGGRERVVNHQKLWIAACFNETVKTADDENESCWLYVSVSGN